MELAVQNTFGNDDRLLMLNYFKADKYTLSLLTFFGGETADTKFLLQNEWNSGHKLRKDSEEISKPDEAPASSRKGGKNRLSIMVSSQYFQVSKLSGYCFINF